MKWICYAVTMEWMSLDKAAALQCSFAILPSSWTHLFLKMTRLIFFLMTKYFLPHPRHSHPSHSQKPFVNAGNEKKMEKGGNHSQEMGFWTKLGVKCGHGAPGPKQGGDLRGIYWGEKRWPRRYREGFSSVDTTHYKGWVSVEVGGASISGWVLTSRKPNGIMFLAGVGDGFMKIWGHVPHECQGFLTCGVWMLWESEGGLDSTL